MQVALMVLMIIVSVMYNKAARCRRGFSVFLQCEKRGIAVGSNERCVRYARCGIVDEQSTENRITPRKALTSEVLSDNAIYEI